MDNRDRCPECGEMRPASGHGGLCPACLLRAGVAGGTRAELDPDFHDMPDATAEVTLTLAPAAAPGGLERLGEPRAEIPRVRLRASEPVTGPGPVVDPSFAHMPGPTNRHAPSNSSVRSAAAAWA